MKNKLLKHIFMKIKDNYKRFLSLLCMALLGVGFYAGIQAASPDMLKTLDTFYDENNVYDIEVVSNFGLTKADIKELSKIKNIEKVVGTYSKDVYLNLNNKQYVLKLIGLNKKINNIYIEKGRLPSNNNEIVVENSLLEDNNLTLNDSVTIENNNYKIVGTMLSPLYFSNDRPSTTLGNGKVNYLVYLNENVIKQDVYTNIYLTVKGTKDKITNSKEYKKAIKTATTNIEKIQKERESARYDELYSDIIRQSETYNIHLDKTTLVSPKWYIFDRLDNVSCKELINASENLKQIGNVFPIIFFCIAILVSLISMMRMIEEDRTENGTLKSLGFNNFQITSKYVIYSLLATIIGGLLGIVIGSLFIPRVIWNAYKTLFTIPKFICEIDTSSNIIGLLICIICICGTTIFVCIKNLKEVPANLMRPKAPKTGKKIILEHIPFIWKRLKFSSKITIRNIFRYKSRVLTTIIGITGCTALILTGFGLRDSIKGITNFQFTNIFKYDKMLMLRETANASTLKNELLNNPIVKEMVETNINTATVTYNKEEQEVTIIVPNNKEELNKVINLIDATNDKNENLIPKDNTCIISEKTSKLLDVNVGDKITILDHDHKKHQVTVDKIIKNYINQYLYLSKTTYENIFGDYKTNSYLIKLNAVSTKKKNDFDEEYISKSEIASIISNEDMKKSMNDMIASIDSVVAILIVAAVILAFVVLYNLSNINISERKREIATLKVLGFYPNEVDRYITQETIILTIIGITLGLVSGSYLCHYIISTCEPDYLLFDRRVDTISYILSALITVIFTIIVNIVTHYNLKKINMVASLKNVE